MKFKPTNGKEFGIKFTHNRMFYIPNNVGTKNRRIILHSLCVMMILEIMEVWGHLISQIFFLVLYIGEWLSQRIFHGIMCIINLWSSQEFLYKWVYQSPDLYRVHKYKYTYITCLWNYRYNCSNYTHTVFCSSVSWQIPIILCWKPICIFVFLGICVGLWCMPRLWFFRSYCS